NTVFSRAGEPQKPKKPVRCLNTPSPNTVRIQEVSISEPNANPVESSIPVPTPRTSKSEPKANDTDSNSSDRCSSATKPELLPKETSSCVWYSEAILSRALAAPKDTAAPIV